MILAPAVNVHRVLASQKDGKNWKDLKMMQET